MEKGTFCELGLIRGGEAGARLTMQACTQDFLLPQQQHPKAFWHRKGRMVIKESAPEAEDCVRAECSQVCVCVCVRVHMHNSSI